jgi:uncharacterized membrane protein
MVVAFIRFSSALMSSHPTERVPEWFYTGTLLLGGLLQHRLVKRVLRAPYLREDVTDDVVVSLRRRTLALPLMALLSGVLAPWGPGPSNLPLMLMPLMVMLFARLAKPRAGQAVAETE